MSQHCTPVHTGSRPILRAAMALLASAAAVHALEWLPPRPAVATPNRPNVTVEVPYTQPGIPLPDVVGPMPPTSGTAVLSAPKALWDRLPPDIASGNWEVYVFEPRANRGGRLPWITGVSTPFHDVPVLVPEGQRPGDGDSSPRWYLVPILEDPLNPPPRSGDEPRFGEKPVLYLAVPLYPG